MPTHSVQQFMGGFWCTPGATVIRRRWHSSFVWKNPIHLELLRRLREVREEMAECPWKKDLCH